MSYPGEPIVHEYPLSDHTMARRRLMWCRSHDDVAWLYDDDRVECAGMGRHDLCPMTGDPIPVDHTDQHGSSSMPEVAITPVKPLTGSWWIMRADGETIANEFTFADAGSSAEPDWVWAAECDHDEPAEYVCQRFVQSKDDGKLYVLDERRRWFGLMGHTYKDGICQHCEQATNDLNPWAYCNKAEFV